MSDETIILNPAKLAKITLNAPQKLNALDMSMIEPLGNALAAWKADDTVKAVLIKGAGEKAFCAGGDVIGVCQQAKTNIAKAAEFFRAEYRTNWRIKNFPKPYIALIDGIVMGGGVGVSVHGQYRIATEKTMLAMPETTIGFFPDVGGTYFLSRLKNNLGMFLGLTGHRVFGADLLELGIATHYIESDKLDALEKALTDADYADDAFATVDAILAEHCSLPTEPGAFAKITDQASRLFSANSLAEITANLAADDSEFSTKIQKTLSRMSPTSMAVTFAQIKQGAALDFDQCMQIEMRIATHMLEADDFYEGVRALLVDKDKSPKWQPQAEPENYFKPIDDELALDWDELL
uniref:3-hydroxyisobutyryl-CoA hydrolase n=1 Tax=OCS116 cluster bacterium TaxID=2030921 RepID=A0A2A4YSW6_9PROT